MLHIISHFLFVQCTSNKGDDTKQNSSGYHDINFGELSDVNTSEIMSEFRFVKLETNHLSLVGRIEQIEVYNERIYVLDTYKTMSILMFSSDGKFIKKIEARGAGPGEFITPHSFYIDKKGFLYLLDMISSRLLKYNLDNLDFVEEITIPIRSPLGFHVIPDVELYFYYCRPYSLKGIADKQILVADKKGNIKNSFMDTPPSNLPLYGNPNNFYTLNSKIYICPYFSNKIYQISQDSLIPHYNLSFGKYKMLDNKIIERYSNKSDVMKIAYEENSKLVNCLFVYETTGLLVVRYFVGRDMYVGMWDKINKKTLNFKYQKVIDNLGFDGQYPYPIGTTEDGTFIGEIKPSKINSENLKNEHLKKLTASMSEEDNPILVFYSIKIESVR